MIKPTGNVIHDIMHGINVIHLYYSPLLSCHWKICRDLIWQLFFSHTDIDFLCKNKNSDKLSYMKVHCMPGSAGSCGWC